MLFLLVRSSEVNNIDYNLSKYVTRHYLNDLIMHNFCLTLIRNIHNIFFTFFNFSYMFLNPNTYFFSIWILLVLIHYIWDTFKNKLKKAFCYQKLFWAFTVWTNCSGDLKIFINSRPSASNFKSFSLSWEHFFSHSRSEQSW